MIGLEQAERKCICRGCKRMMKKGDNRIRVLNEFYHLNCYIKYSKAKIAYFTDEIRELETIHVALLKEEKEQWVLDAI